MGKSKRKATRSTSTNLTPLLEPLAALQRLLERFADRGAIIGIFPRIADAENFARKNVERSQKPSVGTLRLRLPTPEDLIILNAFAHRPIDLADIQAVSASHPDLDKERFQFWIEQFAEALELPDLWHNIFSLL